MFLQSHYLLIHQIPLWLNEKHEQREDVQPGARNIGSGGRAKGNGSLKTESCGEWHQARTDPAGWMLHVRRWRGPLGLELAILFQALHHLSTSAPNVLFMLSYPHLLPHPPLMSNSSPLHAAFTSLPFSLFCLHPRPQLYTRGSFSLFIFHSTSSSHPSCTTVLLGGSERRTPHPKSLLTEVVL